MLISATAHYAKFAPSILRALNKPIVRDPKTLFQVLESLKPCPNVHEALRDGVLRERQHHDICKADRSDVIQQVKRYIAGSQSI